MKIRTTFLLVVGVILFVVNVARAQVAGQTYSLSPAVFVRDGWSLYFVLEPTASGERVACIAGLAHIDRTTGDNLVGVSYYPSYDVAGSVVDWSAKSWSAASRKDVIKTLSSQFPLQDADQWSFMTGIIGIDSGTVKDQSTLVDGLLEGDVFSNLMSNSDLRSIILSPLVQSGYPATDLFVEKDASVNNSLRAKLLTALAGEAVAADKFVKTGQQDTYSVDYQDQSTLLQIGTSDHSSGGDESLRRTKWSLILPAGSTSVAFGFDVFAQPALIEVANGITVAQATPGIVVPGWRSVPAPAQFFGTVAACQACAASQPTNVPNRRIWPSGVPIGPWPTGRWTPPWSITYKPDCMMINGTLYALVAFLDSTGKLGFVWVRC